MKTIMLLLCCLIFIKAYGQQTNRPAPKDSNSNNNHALSSIGVYVGCNGTYTTRFGRNGAGHLLSIIGLYGAFGVFAINDKWQIETGLGAMEYGAKYLRFGYSHIEEDTTKFRDQLITTALYVTIPVVLKYSISKKHTLCVGIRGSGQANNDQSVVIGYKTAIAYQETTEPEGDFRPIENQFDVGLILGYEYHFNDRLFASIRANVGLIPFIPRSYMNHLNNSDDPYEKDYFYPNAAGDYNNSISVQLSYSLLTWESQNRDAVRKHTGQPIFPAM